MTRRIWRKVCGSRKVGDSSNASFTMRLANFGSSSLVCFPVNGPTFSSPSKSLRLWVFPEAPRTCRGIPSPEKKRPGKCYKAEAAQTWRQAHQAGAYRACSMHFKACHSMIQVAYCPASCILRGLGFFRRWKTLADKWVPTTRPSHMPVTYKWLIRSTGLDATPPFDSDT
jgi:hypothetical protein